MAVELMQIVKWLDEDNRKYDHSEEKERILIVSGDEDTTQTHYLRARDDGRVFDWQMQILDDNNDNIDIKDHEHVQQVISHMLYLNYNTKFGTWEYDPSDGDIRLSVEIPLEDAIMTKKQFDRVFGYMLGDGATGANEIRHILKTGEVPKDSSDADTIAKLETLLAMLKADKGSSSSSADSI